MTTYRHIGSTDATQRLGTLREARGTRLTDAPLTDLIIVAAPSISEAVRVLDELDSEQRARTVVVGIDAPLDIRHRPVPGTLAHLLETYKPLGTMRDSFVEAWPAAGFIGSKELASKLGDKYLNLYSSRAYAAWMDCTGDDAADFLLRVVAANDS